MKRLIRNMLCGLLCVSLSAVLAGCGAGGNAAGRRGGQRNTVESVLQKGMNEEDKKNGGEDSEKQNTPTPVNGSGDTDVTLPPAIPSDYPDSGPTSAPTEKPADPNVDVDLTVLTPGMVYAEVYNIVTEPGSYIGKTMKMKGTFGVYYDEATGQYYFACLIQDATACCQNGIEFVLDGEHVYPDDYPELGSVITVTGVFDTYEDGGYTYCTLRTAKLIS